MPGYNLDPVSRDWGREGVHWTGKPGDEIERVDDMSDYGRDEPIFDGDMHAALYVALRGFPFVLYEHHDVELGAWAVTAYADRDSALLAAKAGEDADGPKRLHAFVIDGREFVEADIPFIAHVGYRAPESALYVHPEPEEK